MSIPRIKICGLMHTEDTLFAAGCGVHAIGLNFYSQSPRFVSISQAQQIIKALPPFITIVGVFVNPEEKWVREVLESVCIDLLQFHGSESEAECLRYQKPYLKALQAREVETLQAQIDQYPHAKALMMDTPDNFLAGGTGKTFDWDCLKKLTFTKPLILAGGLNPENVQAAIARVRPFAVDVASGVESAPGIKSHQKILDFVNKVNKANV